MDFIKIALDQAEKDLAKSTKPFALLVGRGSLEIEIYKPDKVDLQQPHTKDELYVVIRGTGSFICGEKKCYFQPHDVLFAPAGIEHRFEDFSEDFICWVIFYGPKGGETM